jgi:hypothetical protein
VICQIPVVHLVAVQAKDGGVTDTAEEATAVVGRAGRRPARRVEFISVAAATAASSSERLSHALASFAIRCTTVVPTFRFRPIFSIPTPCASWSRIVGGHVWSQIHEILANDVELGAKCFDKAFSIGHQMGLCLAA